MLLYKADHISNFYINKIFRKILNFTHLISSSSPGKMRFPPCRLHSSNPETKIQHKVLHISSLEGGLEDLLVNCLSCPSFRFALPPYNHIVSHDSC